MLVLKERLRWTDGLAFALIFTGVAVSLAGGKSGVSHASEVPAPPDAAAALQAAGGAAGLPPSDDGTRRRLLDVELAEQRGGGGGRDGPSAASPLLSTHEEEQQHRTLQQRQQQRGGRAMWSEGSAEVLLASSVDAYARSSSTQQEVHARGHSQAEGS